MAVGGWWRRARAQFKATVEQDEVSARLKKIERALELQYVDKPQSEVDSNLSKGVATIIESIKDVPNAAFLLENLLVIKITGPEGAIVVAKTLSQEQLQALREKPELLTSPDKLLPELSNHVQSLSSVSTSSVKSDLETGTDPSY